MGQSRKALVSQNTPGAGALSHTLTGPNGIGMTVLQVDVKFSTAPTTAEDLQAWTDSTVAATLDAVHRTIDPSASSATAVMWEGPIFVKSADVFTVDYTNTDARTIGVTITYIEGAVL